MGSFLNKFNSRNRYLILYILEEDKHNEYYILDDESLDDEYTRAPERLITIENIHHIETITDEQLIDFNDLIGRYEAWALDEEGEGTPLASVLADLQIWVVNNKNYLTGRADAPNSPEPTRWIPDTLEENDSFTQPEPTIACSGTAQWQIVIKEAAKLPHPEGFNDNSYTSRVYVLQSLDNSGKAWDVAFSKSALRIAGAYRLATGAPEGTANTSTDPSKGVVWIEL